VGRKTLFLSRVICMSEVRVLYLLSLNTDFSGGAIRSVANVTTVSCFKRGIQVFFTHLNSVDMKIKLFSSRISTSRNLSGNQTCRTRSCYGLSFQYVNNCGCMLSDFHVDYNSVWAGMDRTRILPREKNKRYYSFVYFSLYVSLVKYDVTSQVTLNWIVMIIS
jgi:hypothetical protein